jgi:hypothetical protein
MSNDFFRKYEMQVYPSNRKLRRVPRDFLKTNMWNVKISDEMLYQDNFFKVEEVDCVDVTMPTDRLQELEDMIAWYEDKESRIKHHEEIVQKLRQDERVRIEYPVVQAAYMKYLNLLELCRK